MKSYYFILFFILSSPLLYAQTNDAKSLEPEKKYKPMVSSGAFLGNIAPLRNLKPETAPSFERPKETEVREQYFKRNPRANPDALPRESDPSPETFEAKSLTLKPIQQVNDFEGIKTLGDVLPPDPTGDVGKDHYMEMVNSWKGALIQIWDKKGNLLLGPVNTEALWAQVGAKGYGDPIVQYDHDAQRWVIIELYRALGNEMLLAISDDSDPTGSWKAYIMSTYGFPDYPKIYVWPDAYYFSVNEIDSLNECTGYAIERRALLNGESSFKTYRFQMPKFQNIIFQPPTGVDWEGGAPPPPGTPGYILRMYDDAWALGDDHLELWKVHVNWDDESQSSIEGPEILNTLSFESSICCIGQPPSPGSPFVSSVNPPDQLIMYRAPYRNFGSYESIVLNHPIDMTYTDDYKGIAGLRWYELRRSGNGPWTVYQQGNAGPGVNINRFVGAVAIDDRGDIAMGYSVSDTLSLYPGLRITGRLNKDPKNKMTFEEYTIATGHQPGQWGRWGDYSAMTVDPVDGRTFWFTGEYIPDTTLWSTRVASFVLFRDTNDVAPVAVQSPLSGPALGNAETIRVSILNNGTGPASGFNVSLYADGVYLATETVTDTIQPGEQLVHNFGVTVPMDVPGQKYELNIVTEWPLDTFHRNDTLRTSVQHLLSYNAEIQGLAGFPNAICSSDYQLSFNLKNAAALPLQSVRIHWKTNDQDWQEYEWTGNLAPGKTEIVTLNLNNILNGANSLQIYTDYPNQQADEDAQGDSLSMQFNALLHGSNFYMQVNGRTGILIVEILNLSDQVLYSGEFQILNNSVIPVCLDDSGCYKVRIRAKNFDWAGNFKFYNVFNELLAEAQYTGFENQEFNVCNSARKNVDVGSIELLSPVSAAQLSNAEPVKIKLRNFGFTPQGNIELSYRIDGGPWHTETAAGPLPPLAELEYSFADPADLSTFGKAYLFDFKATVPGDEIPANDAAQAVVLHRTKKDLAFLSAKSGPTCSDTTSVPLELTVVNRGQDDISFFYMNYSVNGKVHNGGSQDPGLLHSGDTLQFYLSLNGLKYGDNHLKIWFTAIDFNSEDDLAANDTLEYDLNIDPLGFSIYVALFTDDKPWESSWDIVDAQNNIVASQNDFTKPNNYYFQINCINRDQCYKMRLYDTGHDGMNGSVLIETAESPTIINSFPGGNFGSMIEIPFCTTTPCAGLNLSVQLLPASAPGVADGSMTIFTSGGAPGFMYSIDGIHFQASNHFNGLLSGTYTIVVVDNNDCSAQLTVYLGPTSAAQEPLVKRSLSVSPNPASGLVWVELPALNAEKTVQGVLYGPDGKMLESFVLMRWNNNMRGMFALDERPAGVYTLKVTSAAQIFTARVVRP